MRWLAMAQWFVWSIERRMYIYMHDCIAREELIDRRLPMHGKRRKRGASESTSSAYAWKGIDFVCLWNAGPTELYTTAHNPIRKKEKNKANPTTRTAARRRRSRLPSDVSVARVVAVVPCAAPRDHAFSPAWPSAARPPTHPSHHIPYQVCNCCVDRLMPHGFACSSPSIHTLVTKQI